MPLANSDRIPELLLDTSVVSAFVNAQMQPIEEAAFRQIVEHAQRGQLSIYASTVTREEIDAIPLAYQSSHLREYETLARLRASQTAWIETNAESPDVGKLVDHPAYLALKAALKDENDARLIFQAKMAGVRSFVTLDAKTILNKASVIESLIGVQVQSPSQYFSTTLKSA